MILLVNLIVKVTLPTNLLCLLGLLHCHVRKHGSVRGLASVTILDSVFITSRLGKKGHTVIIERGGGSVVRRAFQGLHAGLNFIVSGRRGILLYASIVPNRNGAFMSAGLTVDVTLVKHGILVVNLSIHGPHLTGLFSLRDNARNIATCLTKSSGSSSFLHRRVFGSNIDTGLSIVPTNLVPPGPKRLVASTHLSRTFTQLHR